MAAPVPLRLDLDAEGVGALAKGSRDPAQPRRLLALSALYAGGSRSEAALLGGAGLQTVRDRVVAFDAHGPDGLVGGEAPGARPPLNGAQREALRALVEHGPMPAGHGVVRWRLIDLAQILFEDQGVAVCEQTLKLVVPANITLLPLPARSPELNPVENLWQFMRDTWLGNRIFKSYADILDHCCDAWNALIDRPGRVMSSGLPAWAHGC